MLDIIHVILPKVKSCLSNLGWKKGGMIALFVLGLSLCLSGSGKVSIQFSGQSAYAATQQTDKDYQNIADMGVKEKKQYTQSLRKHIVRNTEFMMKMIGQDINILFGAPDLVRRDGEIVSFHYKSDNCLMDVYVQGSEEQSAPVIHYEFRSRKTATMNFGKDKIIITEDTFADEQACLQDMIYTGQSYTVAAH